MDHHKTSNPSFSSTLLDAIYRSIDKAEDQEQEQEQVEDQLVLYRETMGKKQGFRDQEEMANYQRACLIEKWMEKKAVLRRSSEYSSSSSSDSSYGGSGSCGGGGGGFFSSSEAESIYGVSSSSSSSSRGAAAASCYGLNKAPKPIRMNQEKDRNSFQAKSKQQQEGGSFLKTKSRALKIYGDLKKVKQPISPGGKLASFLNSIFTPGNSKQAKLSAKSGSGMIDSSSIRNSKSASASTTTCSSASSFSRSCLSKTPSSSRGKPGLKRSVRFVDDEDHDHHQHHHHHSHNLDSDMVKNNIRSHVLEKNRRVEEMLRNFQVMKNAARINDQGFQNLEDEEEDEDEDDAASYASSDLFELDNLSAIGMDQRYREELPVYETTHLGTNRAIANGLIL